MKCRLVIFLFLCGLSYSSYSQQTARVDTISTFDYGKIPPAYFSNKVFWEKNYDKDNNLLFEGLKYNSCFIGAFKSYWNSGILKSQGQYLKPATANWEKLKAQGQCSVMNGTWKNYNQDGELMNTYIYLNGKIVKEY